MYSVKENVFNSNSLQLCTSNQFEGIWKISVSRVEWKELIIFWNLGKHQFYNLQVKFFLFLKHNTYNLCQNIFQLTFNIQRTLKTPLLFHNRHNFILPHINFWGVFNNNHCELIQKAWPFMSVRCVGRTKFV